MEITTETPTTETPTNGPTPTQRRDAALAAWNELAATTTCDDPALVAAAKAAFAAAPSGRALLDNAYNATVAATTARYIADPALVADLAPRMAALTTAREAVAPPMRATTTTAPAADPAAIRAAALDRLGTARAILELLRGAVAWADAVATEAAAPFADDAATSAEEDATLAAATAPDAVTTALARIGKALDGSKSSGARGTRATTTGDWSGAYHHGPHALDVTTAPDGTLVFTVTAGDGTVRTSRSASGAALLVNGGTAVSGRAYWHPGPVAPAAE